MKPCIRNIKRFKKGCPESEECMAWIELPMTTQGGEKEIVKQCLDLWVFKFLKDQCGLLEGTQQAIESFRNNMYESLPAAASVMVGIVKEMQDVTSPQEIAPP